MMYIYISIAQVKKLLTFLTTFVLFLLSSGDVMAGTFSMSPTSGNIIRECPDRVSINIDTQGISSNSADVKINFDPTEITIIDSNPLISGKQIIPGTAYETYVGNQVDELNGVIRLSGVSFSSNLNGTGLFAQIEFESKPGMNSGAFDIEFLNLGNTLDSNIAEANTSDDTLTGAIDGSYSFVSGVCNPDTNPPVITFLTPQNNQTGVPLSSNLIFTLVDSQSDIDLASLVIVIAGQSYTINDSNVSYTGSGQSYTITLVPSPTLPSGQVIATISVADVYGNTGAGSIIFNRPAVIVTPEPTQAPLCGQACSTSNPCSGGLSCQNDICIIVACIGRNCTCNVTLQQCGNECIDDTDCEANLYCSGGLCKITSCVDIEDCACTPPDLQCEEPAPTNPIDNIINNQTVKNIVKNVTDTYERLVPEPIKALVDEVSLPGLASGILTLGLLANILSFILAVRSPQLLFLWLGLFFGKDKSPWGIIYDAQTGKALPYASIRVYLKGTKTLVEQRISDMDGKYGMVLSAGKYRMEIEHADYIKEELDINIETDNDVVPNDIELAPRNLTDVKASSKFSIKAIFRSINQFFDEHFEFMIYSGLVTSIIAIFLTQTVFNIVMLVLYALASIAYYFNRRRAVKKWGVVVDSKTDLRIPYAIVKLFDRNDWKMIDTQMTNQNGSFGVFNEPGKYAILVSAKGYEFPSKRQKDLKLVEEKIGLLELDIFQTKKLQLILYVDPLKAGQRQSRLQVEKKSDHVSRNDGNLPSPFGT